MDGRIDRQTDRYKSRTSIFISIQKLKTTWNSDISYCPIDQNVKKQREREGERKRERERDRHCRDFERERDLFRFVLPYTTYCTNLS